MRVHYLVPVLFFTTRHMTTDPVASPFVTGRDAVPVEARATAPASCGCAGVNTASSARGRTGPPLCDRTRAGPGLRPFFHGVFSIRPMACGGSEPAPPCGVYCRTAQPRHQHDAVPIHQPDHPASCLFRVCN
ncbi:hypothetical protein SXCC_02434 [Gluconacetobacter sp. SXCC-1]|nr:hypothetical protein SXCC_02434 [Gluconacetobacter sp. SXCC-1]